ncbi:MAG: SufD family Fe-S cluster assembly protein [Acidimicrobiales bacterium]
MNGRVIAVDVDDDLVAAGVHVGRLVEHDDAPTCSAGWRPRAPDAFTVLNDASCSEPVLIQVPRGVVVERPIVVTHHAVKRGTASFPRLVVSVGENAQVEVLDHATSGRRAAAGVPRRRARRRSCRAARLPQRPGAGVGELADRLPGRPGRPRRRPEGGHRGLRRRLRPEPGRHSAGRPGCPRRPPRPVLRRGPAGPRLRTYQDHLAADTTSNLTYKGVVGASPQHLHGIDPGTAERPRNAFQTNRNLKLSDTAWAESVPNLEIENNDVRCSHASTVSPVDEDQRFYLESRGVPTDRAEQLIVGGFLDEVIRAVPVPGAAPALRSTIDAKLAREWAAVA